MEYEKEFFPEEYSSFVVPVFGALIIPILIGFVKPEILMGAIKLLYFIVVVFLVFIIFSIINDWERSNKSVLRILWYYFISGPLDSILKSSLNNKVPAVTIFIILLNVCLYLFLPIKTVQSLTYLPHGTISNESLIASFIFSPFLHADVIHLTANMVILWSFGGSVETRIGSLRFVFIYIASLAISQALVAIILHYYQQNLADPTVIYKFHSLGSSGAVAGIMGVYVVRCYYNHITLSVPGFPMLSLPIKLQSTLLIGFFFALEIAGGYKQFFLPDLNDSIRQEVYSLSNVNYWSHIGGYFGGFLLSYILRLNKQASEEAVVYKASLYAKNGSGASTATKMFKKVLEKDHSNHEAFNYLMEAYQFNDKISGNIFQKHVECLIRRKKTNKAKKIIKKYFPKHLNNMSGNYLLHIGNRLFDEGEIQMAQACFNIASYTTGPWQANALYKLSLTYDYFNNPKRAQKIRDELRENFSDYRRGEGRP